MRVPPLVAALLAVAAISPVPGGRLCAQDRGAVQHARDTVRASRETTAGKAKPEAAPAKPPADTGYAKPRQSGGKDPMTAPPTTAPSAPAPNRTGPKPTAPPPPSGAPNITPSALPIGTPAPWDDGDPQYG